jgi:hypothetical protein
MKSTRQRKQQILNKFRSKFEGSYYGWPLSKFSYYGWRLSDFSDDQWGVGTLVRDVTFPNQGVTLRKGTVVCVQRRLDTDKFVTVLHEDLMRSSLVEVRQVVPM